MRYNLCQDITGCLTLLKCYVRLATTVSECAFLHGNTLGIVFKYTMDVGYLSVD